MVDPHEGCEPNYQLFNIEIDPDEFKLPPEILNWALAFENVVTRCYFTPPCHLQEGFRKKGFRTSPGGLPITEKKCASNLCLPMQPDRPTDDVKKIAESIIRLHEEASRVKDAFAGS
jgi:dTDP-4-amino-4,6-dideoxygalactose transaminase